uniref:Focadhesin n=1 Tax=Mastacembelus armatus TaxID=205130 RepID=A0A7N8WSZ9_9TELE
MFFVLQTVRNLVAAVLKEKGQKGQITQSSPQDPALEALWQQCCSDCALVRSVCCDAVVLLVDQGHADLHYVLNSVLNLLPSARYTKLTACVSHITSTNRETHFTCPYSISNPHPFITALENRVDCWPALLLEIDDFIQQLLLCDASKLNEPSYITMLAPFLRYLYCEPQRQPQHALLRHSLLRVLLPIHPTAGLLDSVEAVLELGGFFDALLQGLLQGPTERWRTERARLLLQLLCACQRCLNLNGDCRPLLSLIQQLLPAIEQVMLHLFRYEYCSTNLFFACSLQSPPALELPLSTWYSELSVSLSILRKVADNPAVAADWLLSVHSILSSRQRLPCSLTLIVTHLIITGQEDICQLALNTSQAIATADPCQVPSLIPVLLFRLRKEKNPIVAHAVLNCLPNLGTHTVLSTRTLHMLASAPKLRAVAMRLMTALWKKQDRVYLELQRLLGQQDSRVVVGKDDQWEQILSRAACLRDICRERPYQHGGDMLAAITLILNQCTRPDMATPASLALQGLQELCRAEVVDIISMWRSLGPQLSCDTRPLMVKSTAELLALVPKLTVKSEEYEVPDLLHGVSNCQSCVAARTVMTVTLGDTLDQEYDEASCQSYCELLLIIFALFYSSGHNLTLCKLPYDVFLSAFQLFLTSLVKQEMSQMPRGVYFSALRGGNLRTDQGKTVAGIPSFMLKTSEKNKQPGLKPGLAAGLLLCYELPVQTDRDGKPINRFLISRSRSYQQTLTALIHEGRRADLEMQQKQGKDCPEELQYRMHCAWLWTRDQQADVIKAATKDSPVVQGNSILALSGLAAVLAKYESSLPADTLHHCDIYYTLHWLTMVLDTLLSIISSSYKARGQVFPWYPHRSYSGENTASAIARSCASLALSLLVPVLVVWQRDGLVQVLSGLRAGLPGAATADDSQAVQFHSGLALGMVLSSLCFSLLSSDISGQDTDLLFHSLEALESCCFNPSLEYNTGCMLGLGMVLAALCSSGPTDQHVHVTQTLDKLLSNLQDSSGQGRMQQEVLAYSVACVGVSAFTAGLIDAAKAEEIMNTLRTLTEESQQTPGFSLALGLVVHGLSVSGHGKAEDIHPRLLAAWIKILLAEGCPTMQRLAAVNGLVALVGSEGYLIQRIEIMIYFSFFCSDNIALYVYCVSLLQIITFSGAIGLQSNSACLVGHLHLAHMSTSHSHAAVPQDFSYLSEKSVIRCIIDFVIEAGKKGPEFSDPAVVKTALTPLASVGASFQYPPINWSSVLSPVMRLGFGEDVQHQCVVLAACQAQSSQSASLFLGSWLSPPLVHSLSTRAYLYETLGLWMKHVADDKLQVYVETLGLQQFQEDLRPQRLSLCRSLLQGLAQAMALPNPPNNCWTIVCSTTEKIFSLLPNQIQDDEVHLYVGIAKCLSEMSDTEIDRITRVEEMEKACFVLTYLTSQGRVPLLALNDIIAGVLRGWSRHRVGWFLLQSFYQCRLAASSNTAVSKRMEWLLELMGHIRNVAYGAAPVGCEDTKLATDFLFQVFAAAVVSWGDHVMPLLLGIRAQLFLWQCDSKPSVLTHSLYGEESLTDHVLPQCLLGLSHSLPLLLDKEPWSSQTQKFVDWLLSITEAPVHHLSTMTVSTAKAALLALKSSTEFRKKAVWTRAYGW